MIYILTVYDSLNAGSFLQAYVLASVMAQFGEVAFLDVNHQNLCMQVVNNIVKHLIKRRYNAIPFEILKYRKFTKAHKTLRIEKSINITENDDIYVFGSDEIWNITRKKFLQTPVFFGDRIPFPKKITYAVSINNAEVEDFYKHEHLITLINKFIAISVRDQHSKNVISKLTNQIPEVVLDPTLLYGSEYYNQIEVVCNINKPYCLIYTYGKMFTEMNIRLVKDFAIENRLLLVSIGNYMEWCDFNFPANPYEFLWFVNKSKFIITDTFHGTVFSIIYHKQFATAYPSNKVKCLLEELELTDRILNSSKDLCDILIHDINYKSTDDKIRDLKENSLRYLANSIEILGKNGD